MSGTNSQTTSIVALPAQLAGLALLASLSGLLLASNLAFDIALNSLHYVASLAGAAPLRR